MKLKPVALLHVGLLLEGKAHKLGRLAYRDRQAYFEYDPAFLASKLEISPLALPLAAGVLSGQPGLNDGLHGVFDDSLPDGWGRLLLDRQLRQQGIEPNQLTPLDRLAYVGAHGMGALTYQPDHGALPAAAALDLDLLAGAARRVIKGEAGAALAELIALNGSSAGARPKAMIGVSANQTDILHGVATLPAGYTHWLVKFGNTTDGPDSGAVEYAYSRMAEAAGLALPPTWLFPARRAAGYFAVQRFDRNGDRRLHMHSAAGLLQVDFRLPSLDYKDLLALTMHLTRDLREVEKIYRLAAFNVLAHNRDDHAKNFAFLMNGAGQWRVAPPYDLTFAAGPGGEQSMLVMGEGKAPGRTHLLRLAEAASLPAPMARTMLDQVQDAIAQWPQFASAAGVKKNTRQHIASVLAG